MSISALKSTNKLANSRIRAGKTLLIPVHGNSGQWHAKTTSPTTPHVAIETPVSSKQANGNQKVVHRVKRGDTLWAIAKRYKVRVDQLLAWNQISKNHTLRLNQSLVLFP